MLGMYGFRGMLYAQDVGASENGVTEIRKTGLAGINVFGCGEEDVDLGRIAHGRAFTIGSGISGPSRLLLR